jgi:hypothetical protein
MPLVPHLLARTFEEPLTRGRCAKLDVANLAQLGLGWAEVHINPARQLAFSLVNMAASVRASIVPTAEPASLDAPAPAGPDDSWAGPMVETNIVDKTLANRSQAGCRLQPQPVNPIEIYRGVRVYHSHHNRHRSRT